MKQMRKSVDETSVRLSQKSSEMTAVLEPMSQERKREPRGWKLDRVQLPSICAGGSFASIPPRTQLRQQRQQQQQQQPHNNREHNSTADGSSRVFASSGDGEVRGRA